MNEEGDNPSVSGISLARNLFALFSNAFVIILMFKLIKGEEKRHVIRLYLMPILISSIVCFVFQSEIVEFPLAMNIFAIPVNAFAILLMFKLIKGEDTRDKCSADSKSQISQFEKEMEANLELIDTLKKESDANMAAKECEIELKADEIDNLKKYQDELEARITQLENESMAAMARENSKPTELTIRAKFPGMSKLTKKHSEPTDYAGITWNITVRKDDDNDFSFFLHGEKSNAVEWCSQVVAEFRLISQKSEARYIRKKNAIFDTVDNCAYLAHISYKDLFDEEEGFVMNDSITVAVAIQALPVNLQESTAITLHAKFCEISKLTIEDVCSEPTDVDGVTWKMSVCRHNDKAFFKLDGEKKNAIEWCYRVIAEFRLISQKSEEIIPISRKKLIYDAVDHSNWIGTIPCKDLFDDTKGYVKDDSIIVDVDLKFLSTN